MSSGDLQGVKRPGRDADHPLPSTTEVANGLELYFRQPCVPPLTYHGVKFIFTLFILTVFETYSCIKWPTRSALLILVRLLVLRIKLSITMDLTLI